LVVIDGIIGLYPIALSKAELKNMPSTTMSSKSSSNSKSTINKLNEIKRKFNKTPWRVFSNIQSGLNTVVNTNKCNENTVPKSIINSDKKSYKRLKKGRNGRDLQKVMSKQRT